MLEITADDILQLRDDQLRELVSRLCAAELRGQGLTTAGLTSGGAQDATDGGIDVRVSLGSASTPTGYLPRPETGFQVKVTDMPAGAIRKEMRPGGVLRPSIVALVAQGGAYIMAVAKGTVDDARLRERKAAMREAVADQPNAAGLVVDFYDRDRLARWTRDFPGVTAWALRATGRGHAGWRPVEGLTPEPAGSPFLLDADCTIVDSGASDAALTLPDGIERMRALLAEPRKVVRLVGLSGLGKTRLVQSLFEDGVGGPPLDRSLALYADQAEDPDPSPRHMATALARSGARAILVVDNCNPATHQALAATCRAPGSAVSLITIEYDVRDDEPESTEVFRLDPASDEIIEQLIQRRAPQVSAPDRRRIADLSGGNYRIALALAGTLKRGQSIAALTDTQLFERLFLQRKAEDQSLLEAARILSLVYSFDGVTTADGSELALLGDLAAQSADAMFAHVAELRERGLLQRRAGWRAVLPHALANKLATEALRRLSPERLDAVLWHKGRERILKSAAHRLSFHHDNEEARLLARRWLSRLLLDIADLSALGMYLLRHVAPVLPAETLAAISVTAAGPDGPAMLAPTGSNNSALADLVHQIAYDAVLFTPAARLLAEFLAAEPPNHKVNSVERSFGGLFYAHLSLTLASPAERRALVEELLISERPALRETGMVALEALLESAGFRSMNHGDLGAHGRDYGWSPSTPEETDRWYNDAIALARAHSARSPALAGRIRDIIAKKFRMLWLNTRSWSALAELAQSFAPWPEVWIACRATLAVHRAEMAPVQLALLEDLAKRLAPSGLLEEFEVYIVAPAPVRGILEDAELQEETGAIDRYSAAFERTTKRAEALGKEFADKPELLNAVVGRLADGSTSRPLWFGKGLARGRDPERVWRTLVAAHAMLPMEQRDFRTLGGFIEELSATGSLLRHRLLDDAVTDPTVGPGFAMVQSADLFDDVALDRLNRAVSLGIVWPRAFMSLAHQKIATPFQTRYAELLERVAGLPGGQAVAIELFETRFRLTRNHKDEELPEPYVMAARRVLATVAFDDDGLSDNALGRLTKRCASGVTGRVAGHTMIANFKRAIDSGSDSVWRYEDTIRALIEAQPRIALEELVLLRKPDPGGGDRYKIGLGWLRYDAISLVPDGILLDWIDEDRAERLLPALRAIRIFQGSANDHALTGAFAGIWARGSDRQAMLERVRDRLRPNSYSGMLGDIMTGRLAALESLMATDTDPLVRDWLTAVRRVVAETIAGERLGDREVDERFE